MKGGVRLTIFGPDKWNKGIPDSDSEKAHDSENPKQLTWEERMAKRQRDIQAGRLEPAEPTFVKPGPDFKRYNQMSLNEYKKNYNNLGTIGQQRIQDALSKNAQAEQI